MHAHGYRGRKFGRETDQRRALKRGLMCSLIEYQSITTTLSRCKEIRREAEKLITMARKSGLHNRRMVIARLNSVEMGNLLVDVIAPQIERDSGYLRIERAGYRRGDNAEMGTISFVDEIDYEMEQDLAETDTKKAGFGKADTKPAAKKADESATAGSDADDSGKAEAKQADKPAQKEDK